MKIAILLASFKSWISFKKRVIFRKINRTVDNLSRNKNTSTSSRTHENMQYLSWFLEMICSGTTQTNSWISKVLDDCNKQKAQFSYFMTAVPIL